MRSPAPRRLLSVSGLGLLVFAWSLAVQLSETRLIPGPWTVVLGIVELAERGLLLRHVVASLFRVTWGYLLAVVTAVPLGLCLGWFRRGDQALSPLLQVLRPISPLAWIPIAILWLGVGDLPAVFIIFLGSFSPLAVSVLNAARNVPLVHTNAGRNFGLSSSQLLRWVIFPVILPQVVGGLRITLGIAWLVVVAAEMIAVNSGLGFLIIDARNAGDRYDLVLAGMVLIGLTGFLLDTGMRRLEGLFASSRTAGTAGAWA